jgi:hypothetical protein
MVPLRAFAAPGFFTLMRIQTKFFFFYVDADPAFHISADPEPPFSKLCGFMQIRIRNTG